MKRRALLLVGASGGIGEALLEYLSSRTTIVCLPTYNTNKPTDSSFIWIQHNSNDFSSNQRMFEGVVAKYEISLVIDATGAFFASKLHKTTSDEICNVISTNLVAPLVLAKNAQKFLEIGGKIIFMSSILSEMQLIGSSVYAASKAGLERGIISLGPEFEQAEKGICAIRLGYMDYGMTYKIPEVMRNSIRDNLPEKKFIGINLLGEKILEIAQMNLSDMNGVVFEIS